MAGRPLILKGSEASGPSTINPSYAAGTPVYGLQEMSQTDVLNGIGYRLLKEFAKIDAAVPKTGDLTKLDTVGNVATTLAGDFVDTTRTLSIGARGNTYDISGVTESTTSVFQVLSAVSGSYVRPVCYRNGHLEEMTDADILDTIISPLLDSMTNRGLGSYHFSSGTPKDPTSGANLPGTWTEVFSVVDTYKSGNISNTSTRTFVDNVTQPPTTSIAGYTAAAVSNAASATYTLWRKTDETAPASMPRPLRFANTTDRGKHLVEMTNTEILTLIIPFRNAIINDGRGRYRFSATAPTAGTWARRGDRITDLLNTIGTGSYTWGYALSYTGAFTGYYTSTYTGYFTAISTNSRTQSFNGSKLGFTQNDVTYTSFYSNPIAKYFSKPETSVVNRTYARIVNVAYTTPIVSATTLIQNEDYLWVKRAN
jgi:hypothetical protein